MQNRKDLLQAHRLMTQRAGLALLQAEPDPPDRPLRRLNVGTFCGILVAVMVAAVFGIWGALAHGGAQGLDSPGILIMDSATGTSFVWCQDNKMLCPVVNYASARLALGEASPDQRMVSQASLNHYPRGPLIGIQGLPPLPDANSLVGAPWSVCVQQTVANAATGQQQTVTTLVGGHSVGARGLGGKALVVQASGVDWVIWNGQRMQIPTAIQPDVLIALAASAQTETVSDAWLNAIPQGPDFAPPAISGYSSPVRGPSGGTVHVGQVFTTGIQASGTKQYYVMLRNGLAQITPAQAGLLNATNPWRSHPVIPSLVTSNTSPTTVPPGGLPAHLPVVSNYPAAAPLCTVYTGSATVAPGAPQVMAGGTVPSNGLPVSGAGGLNQIVLPGQSGALVGEVSSAQPGAAGQSPDVTTYFLVTGGHKYSLVSPSVAGMLGYTLPGQRTLLPAGVVDLIPSGPAFDPASAKHLVAG